MIYVKQCFNTRLHGFAALTHVLLAAPGEFNQDVSGWYILEPDLF